MRISPGFKDMGLSVSGVYNGMCVSTIPKHTFLTGNMMNKPLDFWVPYLWRKPNVYIENCPT